MPDCLGQGVSNGENRQSPQALRECPSCARHRQQVIEVSEQVTYQLVLRDADKESWLECGGTVKGGEGLRVQRAERRGSGRHPEPGRRCRIEEQ